jgi:hypothetical protein
MSVDSSIAPPARRRTFAPYVMLYLVAAGLAAAYLIFLGMRPDLVALWREKPDDTKTALIETQRHVERALADINPLKQGVGEVKAEVAGVKTGLEEAAVRDRILLEKVEALERVAIEKVAAQQAAAAKKQAAAKPADPAKAAAAPAAKAAAAPVQKAAPVAGIETGSIEEKKAAAAAPVKPAQVGVLLATGPSVDALRLSWSILNDRASDTVRTLHPRYVVSGKDSERTYGLVAGPLETIADARAVCKVMTERGMACEVSQFRGNSF